MGWLEDMQVEDLRKAREKNAQPAQGRGGGGWLSDVQDKPGQPTAPPEKQPPAAVLSSWDSFKKWGEDQGWDSIKTAGKWLATRALNTGADVADLAIRSLPTVQEGRGASGMLDAQLPEHANPAAGRTALKEARARGDVPDKNLPGLWGKLVDAGVEGAMGGVLFPGGSSLIGAVSNLLGGAAGEAAGQATEGKWYEPYARLFAGGTAGAAPGIRSSIRSRSSVLADEATRHYTPQDWAAAQRLVDDAAARGIQLMPHEALARVASEPIAQLAGHVAASPQGGPIGQVIQDRVPGIRAAVSDAADPIALPPANPKQVDRTLTAAADAAVRRPQNVRSQAADQLYAAAEPRHIPQRAVSDLVNRIDTELQRAHPMGTVHTQLTNLRNMLVQDGANGPVYQTNIGRLDEVFTEFRDLLNARAYEPTNRITEKTRTTMQPIIHDLRDEIARWNRDYAAGLRIYRGVPGVRPSPYTEAVDAAQQSGTAQVARGHDAEPAGQGMSLFRQHVLNPERSRPQQVREDIARLNRENPQAARDAIRLHIDNLFEAASTPTQGGTQLKAGANFARDVAGDARANLIAGIEGATGNRTTALGFQRLLEVLERTGVTPGVGSPTHTRGHVAQTAGEGGVPAAVLGAADLSVGSIPGQLKRGIFGMRQRRTMRHLADVFSDADGVRRLHELALLNPNSARARALAATIWSGAESYGDADNE